MSEVHKSEARLPPWRRAARAVLGSGGLLDRARKSRDEAILAGRNSLHVANEYFFRLPNPLVKLRLEATTPAKVRPVMQTLRRDGFVMVPGFLEGQRLQRMQAGFSRMIQEIEVAPVRPEQPAPPPWEHTTYREQGHDPEIETTFTHDPFQYEQGFLETALDEFILDVVARYFGKRSMLHQAIASRYYPTTKREFGSWQWHHDAWGKRINVMLLLTDVTEKDQFMSYMKGSHRLVHSKERYLNSRFTEAEVTQYRGFERADCIAPAGTLFIFDPNGFHRGNRSLGACRDTLISSYSCGRYIWKFTIPRAFAASLNDRQQSFLRHNPRINYVN